jgi:hypothetical protein
VDFDPALKPSRKKAKPPHLVRLAFLSRNSISRVVTSCATPRVAQQHILVGNSISRVVVSFATPRVAQPTTRGVEFGTTTRCFNF